MTPNAYTESLSKKKKRKNKSKRPDVVGVDARDPGAGAEESEEEDEETGRTAGSSEDRRYLIPKRESSHDFD